MGGVRKSHNNNYGFSAVQILILLSIVIVFIFISYLFFHGGDQSNIATSLSYTNPTPNGTNVNLFSVLSPATVVPKTAECSQQIAYSGNGVVGPLKCSSSGLNVLAWNSLATLEPQVMSLGYNATSSQVEESLCADVHANISNPIEEAVYQISALYYGWSFNNNPSSVINNGTCVNADD